MSRSKSEDPFRPDRRNRPKSSSSGGRKSKTWLSLRDRVDGGRDVSTHLNFPWFNAPLYALARLKKWSV